MRVEPRKWRGALLGLVLITGAVWAQSGDEAEVNAWPVYYIVVALLCSGVALYFARHFFNSIMKESEGTDTMKEIASYVREGAMAYLWRQYRVVGVFFAVVCVILAIMAFGFGVQHTLVPFAFLTGGFFSGLAGWFGMKTATNSAARTAHAASESLDRGLRIAFRAGAVMGLCVVGLALLDITLWFLALYYLWPALGFGHMPLETITVVMLCFGMGASSQALFARVGGGIYTKAADVGADLVGKVEAGIPEDDPRNPATIADNVGDNVGDVAGMGADLYESYAGSILASAALGVAAASANGWGETFALQLLTAPMLLAGIGILLSIWGIYMVKGREGATMSELLWALNKGIYVSSLLVVVATAAIVYLLGFSEHGLAFSVFLAVVVGLIVGIVIGKGTEYATAAEYKPTQQIAKAAETGPATLIISGIAEGMMSTWVPISAVCVGMLFAFGICNGFSDLLMGLYGVAMAAVGMLSTLGITLATDAYGPIADNAGGIAEMSLMDKEVREKTDALDSLGNTTAAIGKGFAIGSAALTALALLASYMEEVRVSIHREAAVVYVAPEAATGPVDPYVVDMGYNKVAIAVPGADDGDLHSMEMHTASALIMSDGGGDFQLVVDAGATKGETISLTLNEVGPDARGVEIALVGGGTLTLRAQDKASMQDFMRYYNITLMNPKVLIGVFMGVLLVFVFGAMTMKAVGRAAMAMVNEVRRQFKEFPGIMQGTEKPDYARCVEISTAGAQKEMILPSMLAITVPIAVGLVLNVSGVMGMLVGCLCGGFAVAIFMANAGGAWDNAKKYIEAGNHGGKGSEAHKAGVVGDTVGDPFKDTSGPSLNILIKLTSMVSIVFSGLIVKAAPIIGAMLGLGF